MNNEDIKNFVTESYINVLRRYPDPTGLFRHVKLIENGIISKEQFLNILKNSPEYKGMFGLINNEPWFARGAIIFLERILNKNLLVFEYGSGGSTGWFAKRSRYLISVEHDNIWYNKVSNYLRKNNINNVNLIQIDLNRGYVDAINNMGNFDLISIDGRRRSDCIRQSYTHVNTGGYILIDDAERVHYHQAIKSYLSGWKIFKFHDTKLTSIFQNI